MSCKVYNSSFNPLFHFLEDFDSHYSRQQAQPACRYVVRQAAPQWRPKFDIRETEQAYEFFAELSGVSKEDVNIKFADHQTIVIEGKTERSYNSAPATETPVEEAAQNVAAADDDSDKHSTASYQATVEDDFEDISSDATTATVDTEKTEKVEPKEAEKPQPEAKTAPNAKYWLTERSFGQFSRSFQFPTLVDQDAVSASFQDGVLAVIVPKAKKHEARPITIN